ncbi:MAG: cyclin family protein [Promethearchaeota archaeon]
MPQPESTELAITAYAIKLNLPHTTQKRAIQIFVKTTSTSFSPRKKVKAIIAATLYIAGILEEEPRTLSEVGWVTGVSPNTVQKHKTQIVHELGIRKE